MDYFEKNIAAIEKTNPMLFKRLTSLSPHRLNLDFEPAASKIGDAPSFKINGITVHSLYNPVSEGKKWAASLLDKLCEENKRIIVFGLGFGYHIRELIKLIEGRFGRIDVHAGNNPVKICVFEPSVESLNFILHSCDIAELLSDKIDLVVPETETIDISDTLRLQETLMLKEAGLIFCELSSYKNIFSDIYDLIYKLFNINQFFNPSSFRILVVQPMYGGSSTIGNYIYEAFLNCGYDAKLMDFAKFYESYKYLDNFTQNEDHINSLRQMFENLMSEALLSAVFNEPPDMVFFMAQSPINERIVLKLRRMGIQTAYWFVEDFRTLKHWNSIAKYVDYFFTIQKDDFFKELKDMGLNNFHYIPLACLPKFHKKITERNNEDERKYGSDVSFAGAGYFNRKNVFAKLTDFDFKIWGNDWQVDMPLSSLIQNGGRRFTEKDVVNIYNYSKININLHSSMWHWDINTNGDFLNPRLYEILGCGGFQLVDERKYLKGVFEDGKDLVVFKSVDDLRKKIRYYLDNEDERLAIAEHGYKTVRDGHTYEQRVSKIMSIMLLNSYDVVKQKFFSRRANILKLLKETENDAELHSLLLNFADRGRISIADMVNGIKKGKGRLSKTEAMILMLWSVKSKLAKID